MANIKAVNNFVMILRDEAEKTINGAYIPSKGVEKPSRGKIVSIGGLVRDKDIKGAKGKTALFHKGIGFTLPFEGVDYLVLTGEEIISIL